MNITGKPIQNSICGINRGILQNSPPPFNGPKDKIMVVLFSCCSVSDNVSVFLLLILWCADSIFKFESLGTLRVQQLFRYLKRAMSFTLPTILFSMLSVLSFPTFLQRRDFFQLVITAAPGFLSYGVQQCTQVAPILYLCLWGSQLKFNFPLTLLGV